MEIIILVAITVCILSAIKAPKSSGRSRRRYRSDGEPHGLPWFGKRKCYRRNKKKYFWD